MVVELGHGHLAREDSFLHRGAIKLLIRLLHVEAGGRGLRGAVGAAPVRENKARKAPFLLQDFVEGVLVFAGVVAVDAVVGAHVGPGVADLVADFEGQQIGFAQRAPGEDGVDDAAAALLVVDGVVLQFAEDVLVLLTADAVAHHHAGQNRVFAVVLEVAPVAQFAGQIDTAGQAHVVALRALFAADQRAVLAGRLGVPGRGRSQVRGQRRRVATVGSAEAHAVGRADHLQRGNAQPRHAQREAVAAVAQQLVGTDRPAEGRALAVNEQDLLVESQLFENETGALIRSKAGVHPGKLCLVLTLSMRHTRGANA